MRSQLSQTVAVVLAGGFGTRVRHLLPGIPKPMAQVAGKPFIEWVVRYLASQGIRKAILSTGYLADVVERHFQGQPVEGISTRCVAEVQPLGTAGGFLNAARLSGERPTSWLVLNGDSLVLADLALMATELEHPATSGVLLGCRVADASRYGSLAIGSAGELLGFVEKRPGQGVISAGIYLLSDSLVHELPTTRPLSFEQDVFPELVNRRVSLRVCVVEAPFLDIGTPESLRQAEDFIETNRACFHANPNPGP